MFENDTNYLDQHFLIDDNVINTFIKSCEITSNDKVLEIGPGKGVITKLILNNTDKVTVVEKDERLAKYLDNINGINVIYDSVLNIDINGFNVIVTSLPYSIVEPFIYKLIDVSFDRLVMICGKTFADNVINKENTKLSILTNSYFETEKIMDISKESFNPEPRVMSSLIKMVPKSIDNMTKKELIIRYLFKYRYMKVKNALKEILIKIDNITQREAKNIINNYKIDDIILNKLFDELSNDDIKVLIDLL